LSSARSFGAGSIVVSAREHSRENCLRFVE
jgi:hypothetical protein